MPPINTPVEPIVTHHHPKRYSIETLADAHPVLDAKVGPRFKLPNRNIN